LQIYVSTTVTATGFQAYNEDQSSHSSLNVLTAPQAFSALTATKTASKTHVPATMTATTKATLLKLDKCFLHPAKTTANNSTLKSLLLQAQIGSAIMTQNLLLPPVETTQQL
jgi:hypothetical protein